MFTVISERLHAEETPRSKTKLHRKTPFTQTYRETHKARVFKETGRRKRQQRAREASATDKSALSSPFFRVGGEFVLSYWQFLTVARCSQNLEKTMWLKCRDFQRPWNTSIDPEEGTHKVHTHTQSHAHTWGMCVHRRTHTHTQAPTGKCRYTDISALQPKTVSLCWFFWAPKSGLGAETVPTRFFYAMQQVFWGKERCIQLVSWTHWNQVNEKWEWK